MYLLQSPAYPQKHGEAILMAMTDRINIVSMTLPAIFCLLGKMFILMNGL